MATFVLRVELHGAASTDYDRLHASMEAAGFLRTIIVGGLLSHLPTGEYRYESNTETSLSVCERAQRIAAAVRANPAIVVTESASGAGVGLAAVNQGGLTATAISTQRDPGPSLSDLANALAAGSRLGLTSPLANALALGLMQSTATK